MSNQDQDHNDNTTKTVEDATKTGEDCASHDNEKLSNEKEAEKSNDDDTTINKVIPFAQRLGYFNYRPNWLQRFNKPQWLLLTVCLNYLFVVMQVAGFRGVVIPQLEKRYNMTSTYIGSLMSTVDISGALVGVWLTYFAGQRQKSRWIGYGMISFGVGSIVFALPHFVAGRYFYRASISLTNNVTSDLCGLASQAANTANCTNSVASASQTLWVYPFLFVLGSIFCGVGVTTQYTMSIAYMDENVSPRSSPMYIGVYHMMGVVGPVIGFLLGGFLTTVYVDLPLVPKDITPSDPRWIGAWWLGYLLVGVISIIIAQMSFAFPRHLPTYEKSKIKRMSQANMANIKLDSSYKSTISNFPMAFYNIISNPIFFLAAMGLTIDHIWVLGMNTFVPKYIQTQSGWSLLVATTVSGLCIVLAGGVGQVLGGYLVKRWNLAGSQVSRFCFIVTVFNLILSCSFLIYCGSPLLAGVNAPYSNVQSQSPTLANGLKVTAACNTKCRCNTEIFSPVCGTDGLSYISPCLAGCNSLSRSQTSANLNFTNCGCIKSDAGNFAKPGMCSQATCPAIYPLFIGLVLLVIAAFTSFSPTLSIMLRSIPESQTPFGMGIEGLLFRLIGGLTGPVLFGFIIDSTCTLWKEECGTRQFCWQYDNRNLAMYVFIGSVIIKGIKTADYALLWHLHKKQELSASTTKQPMNDKENFTAPANNEKMLTGEKFVKQQSAVNDQKLLESRV